MKAWTVAVALTLVATLTAFPAEREDTEFSTGNCTELHVSYEHDYDYYEVSPVQGGILSVEYMNENVSTTSSAGGKFLLEEDPWIPASIAGRRYNWWQILLQNGGKPGTLKEIQRSNSTNKYRNPCERPLKDEGDNFNAYHYEKSDFKTVYRNETARKAFEGSPDEFLNVFGQFVWTPPPEANDTRVYRILYALDDVGFWVRVEPELCRFNSSRPSLYCIGELDKTLPANLLASLIG